jgi:hypothetical protein
MHIEFLKQLESTVEESNDDAQVVKANHWIDILLCGDTLSMHFLIFILLHMSCFVRNQISGPCNRSMLCITLATVLRKRCIRVLTELRASSFVKVTNWRISINSQDLVGAVQQPKDFPHTSLFFRLDS